MKYILTLMISPIISYANAYTPTPPIELPKTNLTEKVYSTEAELLKAEPTCTFYTDGCNRISGGASTLMWCEDIYGEKGKEKWSCLGYDKLDEYKDNIFGFEAVEYKKVYTTIDKKVKTKVDSVLVNYQNKIVNLGAKQQKVNLRILNKIEKLHSKFLSKTKKVMTKKQEKKDILFKYIIFELKKIDYFLK